MGRAARLLAPSRANLLAGTAALLAGLGAAGARSIPARAGAQGVRAPGRARANPCHNRRLHLRCPDLIMSAPRELELDSSTIPGHVLLRATSSVNNRGLGPVEISAHRSGHRRWRTYQAIYDRRGRRHVFAVRASLVFKRVSGQRYGIGDVGSASYWKLAHLAAFQLWSVRRAGNRFEALRRVRTGPKVDYCLRDLTRTRPSRRSPAGPVYGACNEDARLRHDVFGTSVGWSDIYPSSYPEQWIDVTGLRGTFAFVLIADPRDFLHESDERNNVSETYVQLPAGRVLGRRVAVSHA